MKKSKKKELDLTFRAEFIKGLIYINLTAISSIGAYIFVNFDSLSTAKLTISLIFFMFSLITFAILGFKYRKILDEVRS